LSRLVSPTAAWAGTLDQSQPNGVPGSVGLGADREAAQSVTLASGKYSLKRKKARGRFYAKDGRGRTSGETCLATQSKAIRVGHR
jgi:hypothetical protein